MHLPHVTHGLTFRLICIGVLLIALGGSLRYMVASDLLRDSIQEVVAGQQLSLANYVAEDIESKVRLRRALLEKIAQDLPPELLTQPSALEAWLAQRHNFSPLFSLGLAVIPPDGLGAIADYPALGGRRSLDFNALDWFRASRDTGVFYVGRARVGRAAHQNVVVMSIPVKNADGQVRAVLMGVTAFSMPGFLDAIQNHRIAKTGSFLLFSPRDQQIITATEPSLRLTPTPPIGVNRLHDQAMSGWRGVGVTVNAFGIENLAAFASVPTAGWVLVARIPTQEAFQPVDAIQDRIISLSFATSVVLVIFLVIFLGYSFRPLRESSRQMRAMAQGDLALSELPVVRKDEIGEMVESFNALTRKLLAAEDQMVFMAHHDALTELPNRRAFIARFKQSLALATRQSSPLALLFIDLDGFKTVNDQKGHKIGDVLLQEVARRLQSVVRQSDLISRFGGDEFVVLLTDCDSKEAVTAVCSKLIAKVSEPFVVGNMSVNVGASVGISLFPEHAIEVDVLLALADTAMYDAKQAGGNTYRFALPHDSSVNPSSLGQGAPLQSKTQDMPE